MQQEAIRGEVLSRDEAIRILEAHEAELRAQGVTRLALFGSTARGEARPDSDVDVLVEIDWQQPFSLIEWAGLELYLRDLLDRRVEVVMRRPQAASDRERPSRCRGGLSRPRPACLRTGGNGHAHAQSPRTSAGHPGGDR